MVVFLSTNVYGEFFRNFYAGLRPALAGMVFYAGISFGTYETLREKVQEHDHIFSIPLKNDREETFYCVNLVMGKTGSNRFIQISVPTGYKRLFRCNSSCNISIICISD